MQRCEFHFSELYFAIVYFNSLLYLVVTARLVCYTAVFSVVTQCSFLRDDTKNGCVADYGSVWLKKRMNNSNKTYRKAQQRQSYIDKTCKWIFNGISIKEIH